MYLSSSNLSQHLACDIIKDVYDINWHKNSCLMKLNKFLALSKDFSNLEIIIPDAAFFVCFRIEKNQKMYYSTEDIFKETNLIFRDCNDFGLETYNRMNLCISDEQFNLILHRMKEFLRK